MNSVSNQIERLFDQILVDKYSLASLGATTSPQPKAEGILFQTSFRRQEGTMEPSNEHVQHDARVDNRSTKGGSMSTTHGKMGDTNLGKNNSKSSAVGRSKVDGLARQKVGGSVGSAHCAAK